MIDLISLDIDITHTPFGTTSFKQRPDASYAKAKQLSDKVELYDGANKIFATSLHNGTRINIRCNPLKPLQGHNVFGTDNVIGLCSKLIGFVLNELGIAATSQQLKAWGEGRYKIRELHITYRFKLPSHGMLHPLVVHLLRNIHTSFRPAVLKVGTGITLQSLDGRAEWMFYDKLQYLKDKRRQEQQNLCALVGNSTTAEEIWEQLQNAATGNIRVELRLSKKFLQARELDDGEAWVKGKPKEIFIEELALLRLAEIPSVHSVSPLMEKLQDDKPLYRTFRLWLIGDDLGSYFSTATIRNHRLAIKEKTGIDILLDILPLAPSAFDLAEIFDPTNIGPDFPSWAKKYPHVAYKGGDLCEIRKSTTRLERQKEG